VRLEAGLGDDLRSLGRRFISGGLYLCDKFLASPSRVGPGRLGGGDALRFELGCLNAGALVQLGRRVACCLGEPLGLEVRLLDDGGRLLASRGDLESDPVLLLGCRKRGVQRGELLGLHHRLVPQLVSRLLCGRRESGRLILGGLDDRCGLAPCRVDVRSDLAGHLVDETGRRRVRRAVDRRAVLRVPGWG